jgi:glucokinase
MPWNLVADIGGTNMRIAAGWDGKIIKQQKYPTVGDKSLEVLIREFCELMGSRPDHCAMAAAGIVENGSVKLTNAGTVVSEDIINQTLGIIDARVLNDFEAAAWALADVDASDCQILQGDLAKRFGPRVIIGPGTGLGVGALIWQDGRPFVVQGEGGHIRLSPDTQEELEIFRRVGELWPQTRMGDGYAVEAEAVVSGTGLPYFHRAIAANEGVDAEPLPAGQIFLAARSGKDRIAAKTARLFTKYLGEFAGDMAVTFAATGGVFLVGGVINANPWIFDDQIFLEAFNSGGRHSKYRESLPVIAYRNPDFGMVSPQPNNDPGFRIMHGVML